ncbi:phosphonate metabolism protein/1,5-bisphosphokinase (PRPP-forming) PhnN [uncultured Bartonella sp.]|uniref:phosphonate metabolism protein/1,5-bisphosphokinase (PRPP-forming) PhnN n=1 Tax=uncultured Bartonella sp. TaxID=104108 RepID=UPI002617E7FA|nr:phosphonate metabolism protein/1,5-bisphosphokinase (PRPP-forming) PhnN [uncultured Bartonella sp.]
MSSTRDIGSFVAVVGPSGAGKDTLINAAHKALEANPEFIFVRRIITRKPQYEDNEDLSEQDFLQQRQHGAFCLDWFAHGIYYALPKSCIEEAKAGKIVVANISRDKIKLAAALFDNITVVEINAPAALLSQRLADRKREKADDIKERLQRATLTMQLPEKVDYQYIDNSHDVERAITRFINILSTIEKTIVTKRSLRQQ